MALVEASPRYDLGESYGPHLRVGDLVSPSDLEGIALGYGSVEGDPELRGLIARANGVTADDVVLTIGGMHGLFLSAFILCEKGDEVVTTAPLFPPARGALEAVGATLRILPVAFDDGYRPDLAGLRALLSARTRLVSLASPQNPSGVAIPPETIAGLLAAMAEICPGAALVLDETYREARYGDAPAAGAAGLSPKVISIASLSKAHGAPGLRLGWAITRDAGLRAQLALGKFNSVVCCSPVDEALALAILRQGDRIIAERAAILRDGLDRTAAWVAQNAAAVDWVRPDAGAICCIRLKRQLFDAAAIARFHAELAREEVRVAKGGWFDDEAHVFRLGFGFMPMADLDAALRGLTAALRRVLREAA